MANSTQKYGVPALLSFFFPGLGQLIKGDFGIGLLMLIGFIFSWILIFTIIGIIVPLVIWVYSIYDAYNRPAKK